MRARALPIGGMSRSDPCQPGLDQEHDGGGWANPVASPPTPNSALSQKPEGTMPEQTSHHGVTHYGATSQDVSGTKGRAEEFCRRFGLRVPILQAPMAGACPAKLTP